ncbi:hypothetical protein ACHAWX_000225 [Stephanocyclus meneghinianus]
MIKHFLEKRTLIEKEIQSWAKEDLRLKAQVQSVLKLLDSLSALEKEDRRGSSQYKRSVVYTQVAQLMNLSRKPMK